MRAQNPNRMYRLRIQQPEKRLKKSLCCVRIRGGLLSLWLYKESNNPSKKNYFSCAANHPPVANVASSMLENFLPLRYSKEDILQLFRHILPLFFFYFACQFSHLLRWRPNLLWKMALDRVNKKPDSDAWRTLSWTGYMDHTSWRSSLTSRFMSTGTSSSLETERDDHLPFPDTDN
jgi:hypothetical protein